MSNPKSSKKTYKVIFHNQGEVFEVFVRGVYQSDMYGFIEVEEYLFGERCSLVVDPSEEKLKTTFDGVKRSYIPMHSVIRIDEVEKEGTGKISALSGDKIMPFPMSPAPANK